MHRLNMWYHFHIGAAKRKAASWSADKFDRATLGYRALLCENVKELEQDYSRLPEAVRRRVSKSVVCDPLPHSWFPTQTMNRQLNI